LQTYFYFSFYYFQIFLIFNILIFYYFLKFFYFYFFQNANTKRTTDQIEPVPIFKKRTQNFETNSSLTLSSSMYAKFSNPLEPVPYLQKTCTTFSNFQNYFYFIFSFFIKYYFNILLFFKILLFLLFF